MNILYIVIKCACSCRYMLFKHGHEGTKENKYIFKIKNVHDIQRGISRINDAGYM